MDIGTAASGSESDMTLMLSISLNRPMQADWEALLMGSKRWTGSSEQIGMHSFLVSDMIDTTCALLC